MSKIHDKKNIIVIGAGIAGLAAARAFQDHNYSIKILEARNRIGGRLLAISGVELGGQWIHGTEGNPLTNLVRQSSIPIIFLGGDSSYVGGWEQMEIRYGEGKKLSEEEKWESILIWDDIHDQLDAICHKKRDNSENDCSLAEVIENIMQSMPELSDLQRKYILWHSNLYIRDDYAANRENLSALYHDDGFEVFGYGDSTFVANYQAMLNLLAEGIDIQFNAVVTKIDYSHEQEIIVSTPEQQYVADAVIVTLPLGVLKADSVCFEPKLPQSKHDAIARLGFGCLAKIALFFEKPFWPEDQYVFGYLSDDSEHSPTQVVSLWKTHHLPALLIIIGGNMGWHLEHCQPEEATAWAMRILEDMFGKDSVTQPTNMLRSSWSADSFAKGAYLYMAVGATPADIETLALPIDNRIYFAGEACNRQFWGCVHGAYLSGLRSAAAVMQNPAILPAQTFTENRRWRNIMQRAARFFVSKTNNMSPEDVKEILDILMNSDIFSSIGDHELRLLPFFFEKKYFHANDIICKEGDLATEVYVLAKGEILVSLAQGSEKSITQIGTVIGEYGLFFNGKRTAQLTAQSETLLLCLDYHRFKQFLFAFPEVMFNLYRISVHRLISHP